MLIRKRHCIRSKGFIHPDYNVYALRKNFALKEKSATFSYELSLCGYNEKIGEYMYAFIDDIFKANGKPDEIVISDRYIFTGKLNTLVIYVL